MKPIVILEMANNHIGSLDHAKQIIKSFYHITRAYSNKIDFVLKYQFRDKENFIHKDFYDSGDKFVERFKSTFLSDSDWNTLITFSKRYFKLACTPFDEISVDKVFEKKFNYLKIASCSITDWPLIEYIAKKLKKQKKKLIASLGSLNEDDITKVTSFFKNRKIDISFFYCVAKYPTKPEELNLSYFSNLREKYGERIMGFSSHEDTDITLSPAIAYAAGARIFEKHVGLETKKVKLNAYSVKPNQLKLWLDNLSSAIDIWGSSQSRNKNTAEERKQLDNFKRGIYLKKDLKKSHKINAKDIYYAFPAQKNQVKANDFFKFQEFILKKDLKKNSPLKTENVRTIDSRSPVLKIREKIQRLISISNIILPKNPKLEISHHYGISKFHKFGITMINVINQSYCKKLILMLPGQKHPEQYHNIKKESFFILFGTVQLILDKKKYNLKVGDLITIKKKQIHAFTTNDGAIIEELSTTHIKEDTYYLDKKINANKNRKSFIYL